MVNLSDFDRFWMILVDSGRSGKFLLASILEFKAIMWVNSNEVLSDFEDVVGFQRFLSILADFDN